MSSFIMSPHNSHVVKSNIKVIDVDVHTINSLVDIKIYEKKSWY